MEVFMIIVRCDKVKNRLYLTASGFMIDEDVKRGAEEIKKAQLFAAQNGMGRAVRVIKNVLVSIQTKRTSEGKYDVITAGSIEEAEEILDKK